MSTYMLIIFGIIIGMLLLFFGGMTLICVIGGAQAEKAYRADQGEPVDKEMRK